MVIRTIMLSILIPTYNYDITVLVQNIHKQLINAKIDFEIICLDDLSDEKISNVNLAINKFPYTTYQLSSTNNGIAITRQLLCNKANYDWILLIDADTELRDDNFITNYLSKMNSGFEVIFGGFAYKNIKPHKDFLLRWKYGKQCEALSAAKRNANPYKITIAANLLVKKETYKSFNLDTIGKLYAMDYYFGAKLKQNKIAVLHIDNQIYHLGIEKSSKYLRKKELAAKTLLKLYIGNHIKQHSNSLLSTYILLKNLRLNYVCAISYKLLNHVLKKNLLGKYPSVMLLQLYKVLYICHFDLKKSMNSI